jgi:putative transposase
MRGKTWLCDMTDAEWAVLESLLPPPATTGRPRKWGLRRIVEAIFYLLRGGLPWRMLPPCFPPASAVRYWFYLWRDNGLWLMLNHALLMIQRELQGREASPSAGVIDSQSVKTTIAVGTPVTGRPPHRSGRAQLRHPAPTLGE